MLVKIFSAICKKPTIVYLVYHLLKMCMIMNYENVVTTLCYHSVILTFSGRHFLTYVCLV